MMRMVLFAGVGALAVSASTVAAPQPAGAPGTDRCAELRASFARQPPPTREAQASREQQLRDCVTSARRVKSSGATARSSGAAAAAEPTRTEASPIHGAPQRGLVEPVTPKVSAPLPEISPPKHFALKITVTTGDDDLRSDSSAAFGYEGQTMPCILRALGGETWQNNLSHWVTCWVTTASISSLKAMQFIIGYSGQPGQEDVWNDAGKFTNDVTHNWDNWNVDEIRVEAVDPATNQPTCIFDAAGSPLVRFTGQNPKVEILAANFPC